MDKTLFLKKAEQYLNDKLDKKLFFFELDNGFNDFVTFIYIKVIKSGKYIKLGCSYSDQKISFWNNFDEEFTQFLNENGLAEILSTAFNEKRREYQFSFFNNGWAEHSVYSKMVPQCDGDILNALNKILADKAFEYDYIGFTDFFGDTNKIIKYNKSEERFIID